MKHGGLWQVALHNVILADVREPLYAIAPAQPLYTQYTTSPSLMRTP